MSLVHPTATSARQDALHEDLLRQQFDTPCYVFDPETVGRNYRRLKDALGTRLIVSIKANPDLSLLVRCIHEFVDGIEFASVAELSLGMGRTTAPKYANNPSMDSRFLRGAIAAKATIIVDGLDHAAQILAAKGGRRLEPLVLRLNSASLLRGCGERQRHADHFGMDLQTAIDVGNMLVRADCQIAGVHVFAGSFSFGDKHLKLLEVLPEALKALQKGLNCPLSFVNLGGGFDADWESSGVDFEEYRRQVRAQLGDYVVAHESGRAIFKQAGWFITRVAAMKKIDGTSYAVCDGGMSQNFLLCQTERFAKKLQAPALLPKGEASRRQSEAPIFIVGSSCSSNDVIGALPAGAMTPQVGDLLCFDGCGAYNNTYTPARFLSADPARVFLRS